MTDECDGYTKSFARMLEEDAERRKCWAITGCTREPGFDFNDFLYFFKKAPISHPEEVYALKRMHFKGLGIKNPTIRCPGTADWRMLHLRAARLVVKHIGKTGDPEDRPFPARFTFIRFIPRGKTAVSSEEDRGAAA